MGHPGQRPRPPAREMLPERTCSRRSPAYRGRTPPSCRSRGSATGGGVFVDACRWGSARAGQRLEALSVGLDPRLVRSEAVAVTPEIGIDVRDQRCKGVSEHLGREQFGDPLTVCDRANAGCPIFPGVVSACTGRRLIGSQQKSSRASAGRPSDASGSRSPALSTGSSQRNTGLPRLVSTALDLGAHAPASASRHPDQPLTGP
jgi:hypothetical protein